MSEVRDRARAVIAAAAPGPWSAEWGCFGGRVRALGPAHGEHDIQGVTGDAALIAAAPALLAALCDELDDSRITVGLLRSALGEIMRSVDVDTDGCSICGGPPDDHDGECIWQIAADAWQSLASRDFVDERAALRAEVEAQADKIRALEARKAKPCECLEPIWDKGRWVVTAVVNCPDCHGTGATWSEP